MSLNAVGIGTIIAAGKGSTTPHKERYTPERQVGLRFSDVQGDWPHDVADGVLHVRGLKLHLDEKRGKSEGRRTPPPSVRHPSTISATTVHASRHVRCLSPWPLRCTTKTPPAFRCAHTTLGLTPTTQAQTEKKRSYIATGSAGKPPSLRHEIPAQKTRRKKKGGAELR